MFKKNKRKGVQKKKLIDTHCENNINTVAEELVSSGNIFRNFSSDRKSFKFAQAHLLRTQ